MSNSNSINIAAAATAAEAVISWRDVSPRNDHSFKAGAVNASISSSLMLANDCKKRNATDSITEECKGTEATRSDRDPKLSAAGTKDELTCEELSSCGEEILCLTPTKKIGGTVPDVSPLRNYFVKPELWKTISMNCIELNEKAKKLYNIGQNDAALEALYSAEGQRQKLVDLVQSERYAQLYCQIVYHSGDDVSPPLFPLLLDHSSIDNINIPEDKVEEKRNYIYQRSDFDEGMRVFEDMESIRTAYFSVADSQSNFVQVCPAAEATIKFNIGQVLHRQGDLEGASKCYEDAMGVLQHTVSATTTHEILIPILHNFGYALYRRGDIQQAKKLYCQAYDHSIQSCGRQHTHVASALNCLGVLHYHSNSAKPKDDDDTTDIIDSSFAKAMECFEEAMSILDDLGNEKGAERATVMNNCGRLHVQNDEYDTALVYYTQALHIRRDCLGPNSLDYAATCFNAGQCYHQKGKLDDANDLYQEFLRVALMKYGRGHRDVAVVLSGMAQIFQEKHQYDQALELYEESLSAGREALGDDHTEIAMLYNRLGNFNFERGLLEDAMKCYLQGLAIEKKVLPPSHPNILVTLSNLGEIYRQSKQWTAAIDTFSECLEILRRKHGDKDNEEVAKMLETLGLVTDQRGDSSLALKYLRESLSMKRRISRNNDVDFSATLVYIATILSRRRDFQGAMECLTEALQIRESALGRNCRDVAFVLYNIGLIHQQRGRYEAAIESYKDTLFIEKVVLGERHRDIALTLLKLGEAFKAASNFDAALKYFEEYMSIMREISERGEPSRSDQASMARTLNEIGNIYLARGDTRSMMEALNEASRMYRNIGLNPNNVVVNGSHLFALDIALPEAAPAA